MFIQILINFHQVGINKRHRLRKQANIFFTKVLDIEADVTFTYQDMPMSMIVVRPLAEGHEHAGTIGF